MKFRDYQVISVTPDTEECVVIRLKALDNKPLSFSAGQYVSIKNPAFKPEEDHPFSIASSPLTNEYIEFCIKFSGDWTSKIKYLKPGDILQVSEAQGSLTVDESLTDIVFLIGGLGISPIMSILRTLEKNHSRANLILIYGNRTPEVISYKSMLSELKNNLSSFKIVHVFSHLDENHPWTGYRGFITKEIVENEIDLTKNPTFVLVGPTTFLTSTRDILESLSVSETHIVTETL